jgi:pre-mRNA-splicing helicase BRR2
MRQFCMDSWYGKLTSQSNEKVTKYGYLKDEIVFQLKRWNVSLDQIANKELQEAQYHIVPTMQDELYKFASYIPYFEIDLQCQPITRAILKVQVTLTADFEWNDRWNGKTEPFWIMVDNETEILHSEFFTLHKKDVQKKFTKLKNQEGT